MKDLGGLLLRVGFFTFILALAQLAKKSLLGYQLSKESSDLLGIIILAPNASFLNKFIPFTPIGFMGATLVSVHKANDVVGCQWGK